jgi:V8-like Glu-specific endopeptidase
MNADGYPGDKDSRTMWNTFDAVDDVRSNSFDNFLDIVPGSGGSGVYLYLAAQNSKVIYGVVSNQSKKFVFNFPDIWNLGKVMINTATRISPVTFRLICAWMNEPSVC